MLYVVANLVLIVSYIRIEIKIFWHTTLDKFMSRPDSDFASGSDKDGKGCLFMIVDGFRSPKTFTHIIGPIIFSYIMYTQVLDYKNARMD